MFSFQSYIQSSLNSIAKNYFSTNISQHILSIYRILFSGMMLLSIIRFYSKGWIEELYIQPTFFFTYDGFHWVKPLGEKGMYVLFFFMGLAAFFMMVGLFYRYASLAFFLSFTYVELIDKSNYLNHYYFVSILAFLFVLVPAHRSLSIDALIRPSLHHTHIPKWLIDVFKLQLFIVYFYAGLAKINTDWLLHALPLSIWLPPLADDVPIIGGLFRYHWMPYVFSWAGMLYDLSIAFLLLYRPMRKWAYLAVIIFHLLTALLFPIGMFPYIMIICTLIFFSEEFNEWINQRQPYTKVNKPSIAPIYLTALKWIFVLHFCIQILLPLRSHLYTGNVFWTEQGFRFSWRVMLMEKGGVCVFTVKDPSNGQEWEVWNRDYLSPNQIQQMSTQPDMIVQFAHYIRKVYQDKGIAEPLVYADCMVTLNGRRSKPFIKEGLELGQFKGRAAEIVRPQSKKAK